MKTMLLGGALLLALSSCATTEPTPPTIAGVVTADDNFSTLLTALNAADLATVLDGEDPYTVFAPTNAAFAKLPDGTLDTLLQPENREQLRNILLYHVLRGEITSGELPPLDGQSVPTLLEGQSVSIALNEGTVVLNGAATVTQADVDASNGVVHVIDTVLLPAE